MHHMYLDCMDPWYTQLSNVVPGLPTPCSCHHFCISNIYYGTSLLCAIVKVEFHKYGQDKEWVYCDSSRDASERECDRGLLWEEKSA